MRTTSYDVRVHATYVYKGARTTTHWVRWMVAGQRFKEPFKTAGLAKSFLAELTSAASKGEAFCAETGRPASWARREAAAMSWYELVCAYIDMKWFDAAPTHRRAIADNLAPITDAMLVQGPSSPGRAVLRRAYRVLFNPSTRAGEHPPDIDRAVRWLESNTRRVSDLADPDVLRDVVSAFERKLDGTRAAADTIRLRHVTFSGVLDLAVERKALAENPFKEMKAKKRRSVVHQVDRRAVANPDQARSLLAAIPTIGRTGKKLVAFFALMYFAGLRPEEATNVRRNNLKLPPREWDERAERWRVTDWGELIVTRVTPEIGAEWTDSGKRNEERGLKHREDDEERTVPIGPELALFLYDHLDQFNIGPRGLLFVAERGGRIGSSVYGRTWQAAREAVFDEATVASPLAKRPYDLRHACVSMWLNAGVEPPRVAEWAGHSVHVLMRIYAKCIDGGEQAARERVQRALAGS